MAKIFDPRIGDSIETTNPALILLDLLTRSNKFRADELEFLCKRIGYLADFCDKPLEKGD